MGKPQDGFLKMFHDEFYSKTGLKVEWKGGQNSANTAALPQNAAVRRLGHSQTGEKFELADTAADIGEWRVIVEFENDNLPLSNLLKYWPYIRGELGIKPTRHLLICHFSNWRSYATRRDLWEWTIGQMKVDPMRIANVDGRQFDHWGDDNDKKLESIRTSIDWIDVLPTSIPRMVRALG